MASARHSSTWSDAITRTAWAPVLTIFRNSRSLPCSCGSHAAQPVRSRAGPRGNRGGKFVISYFPGLEGNHPSTSTAAILRTLFIKDAVFEAALAQVSCILTAAEVTTKENPSRSPRESFYPAMRPRAAGPSFSEPANVFPLRGLRRIGSRRKFFMQRCDGEGLVEEQETVRVQFPPEGRRRRAHGSSSTWTRCAQLLSAREYPAGGPRLEATRDSARG